REKFPPNTFRCKLTQEGDLITLERESVEYGKRGKIVFSKSQGWNVVLCEFGYEQTPGFKPTPGLANRIKYEWAPTLDNKWRLTRMVCVEQYPPRKDSLVVPDYETEVLVTDFNPNPSWASSYLTPEKFFKFSGDTIVYDNSSKVRRRYRFGHGGETLDNDLDKLVPELKKRGFGKPPERK
ncbi:MAG: hypothetical protein V4719_27305, partial [Planctomycetota bacterium]